MDNIGKEIPWIKGKDLVKAVNEQETLWSVFHDKRAEQAHIKDVHAIMCEAVEEWHNRQVHETVTNIEEGILVEQLHDIPDYTAQALKNMLEIQRNCVRQNGTINKYMEGMYNGLALAYSTVVGEDVQWYTDSIMECQELGQAIVEGFTAGFADTNNP